MQKEKNSHSVAKTVKILFDIVLRTEANTTSSGIAYQPKAPKELSRFKKSK